MKMMTSLAAMALLLAPSVAADDDEIPDPVESEMCGRQVVRDAFTALEGEAGECASNTDYVAPDVTGTVLGTVDEAQGLVDEDRDLVPDALESTVCLVENQNEDYDGVCSGDDYAPPTDDSDGDGVPDSVEEMAGVLCIKDSGAGGYIGICYSEQSDAHFVMLGPLGGGPVLPF